MRTAVLGVPTFFQALFRLQSIQKACLENLHNDPQSSGKEVGGPAEIKIPCRSTGDNATPSGKMQKP